MDFNAFLNLINPLSWISNLGKDDTQKLKEELEDLLNHSTQSLRTILEISKLLDMIDLIKMDKRNFVEMYYNIKDLYIGDQVSDKIRSHCTDIERDIQRINYKASIRLRSEIKDYKDVKIAFNVLIGADGMYICQIKHFIDELNGELDKAFKCVNDNSIDKAKEIILNFRNRMDIAIKSIESIINEMKKAENNIRGSLT